METVKIECSVPSAIYSESIQPLSVLHSGLKRACQPIFYLFWGEKIQKNIYKLFLCNFLVRLLKNNFKNFKFFCLQKVEKTTLKSCSSNPLFSLTAVAAQMAQTEEFMFQNVA